MSWRKPCESSEDAKRAGPAMSVAGGVAGALSVVCCRHATVRKCSGEEVARLVAGGSRTDSKFNVRKRLEFAQAMVKSLVARRMLRNKSHTPYVGLAQGCNSFDRASAPQQQRHAAARLRPTSLLVLTLPHACAASQYCPSRSASVASARALGCATRPTSVRRSPSTARCASARCSGCARATSSARACASGGASTCVRTSNAPRRSGRM